MFGLRPRCSSANFRFEGTLWEDHCYIQDNSFNMTRFLNWLLVLILPLVRGSSLLQYKDNSAYCSGNLTNLEFVEATCDGEEYGCTWGSNVSFFLQSKICWSAFPLLTALNDHSNVYIALLKSTLLMIFPARSSFRWAPVFPICHPTKHLHPMNMKIIHHTVAIHFWLFLQEGMRDIRAQTQESTITEAPSPCLEIPRRGMRATMVTILESTSKWSTAQPTMTMHIAIWSWKWSMEHLL